MTYNKICELINVDRKINEVKLILSCDSDVDLDFIFDHIEIIISCKTIQLLGFVKRKCEEFKISAIIKTIYWFIICSALAYYGSVV